MKFAVLVFPGSNCDIDMYHAIKDELGEEVEYVWHTATDLSGFDGVLVPEDSPMEIIFVVVQWLINLTLWQKLRKQQMLVNLY